MGKRRFRRRIKGSALKIAKRALKKVKTLDKKVGKAELKRVSIFFTGPVTDTGSVDLINGITEGTGTGARIGMSVGMKFIDFRGSLQANAAAAFTVARIMIFRDKRQEIDAKSTPSAILQSVSVYSPLDDKRMKRYAILYDRFFVMDNLSRRSIGLRLFKRFNQEVRFNGNLSGDIEKNGIYILFLSNLSSTQPTLTYDISFGYYDA